MLTRDEIMSMQAGRALDALVAEHVMGWSWIADMLIPPPGDERNLWAAEWDEKGLPHWLPDYSTEIENAWQVVEKITAPPAAYEEAERMSNTKFANWFDHANLWALSASEAAFAICQAALMTTIR